MNWIWIGVIISLIFIEVLSLNFTSIWFVIGGIVGYVLMKFEYDYIIQVLGFLITGILFIIVVRPKIIEKLIDKRDVIIEKLTQKHPFFNHFVPSEIRLKKQVKDKKNNKNNKKKNKKARK